MSPEEPNPVLEILDYRRRVAEIYRRARDGGAGEAIWARWRDDRDDLFGAHPQSALEPDDPRRVDGLAYFDHDPDWRFEAEVRPVGDAGVEIDHSGEGVSSFRRFGEVELATPSGDIVLSLYWLDTYGGGVFIPFRDATGGVETYGGGRYLLDTVKGADLGHAGASIVADFNYAYHPSCVYSDRWSCPLAPVDNHLDVAIRAGERLAAP